MKIDGKPYRSIWLAEDGWSVHIFDQTRLPHEVVVLRLTTAGQVAHAIKSMQTRGAPLIGACAAYGLALALRGDASDASLARNYELLLKTRPTAINLRWALDAMRAVLQPLAPSERVPAAYAKALAICDEDVAINEAIGRNALTLFREAAARGKGGVLNVLTHCNAGWLATVDWGTALAPMFMAHDAGMAIHVWVDETRPRNQGASLTAWELMRHGVPCTVIADNAGGHLMQRGQVDLCIVGTDRVTAQGDVCNKIGTYLKALAAKDNGVPFYVALPGPTIDWTVVDGLTEIPIEERAAREVTHIVGRDEDGTVRAVEITPPGAKAANPAFDVTPARLVTALVTERGVAQPSREGLLALYPERRTKAAE